MEKMTIHRALAELKLIDSRIEKSIGTILPAGSIQKGKLVNGFTPREDFENEAKAKFQSVNDLINRKMKIKSTIIKANGKTNVLVNGVMMTIADAINYKTIIEFKQKLIDVLKQKHSNAKIDVEKSNVKINEYALKLAEAALQKDNIKISDTDALAITTPFLAKNEYHLVDPLEVDKLTEKLQAEIDSFEMEVDAVLSEVNAITTIEI